MNITWPKISICTPIYNRNEWLPLMVFNLQELVYPDKSLFEWVIDDDGTEPLFKTNEDKLKVQKLIHPITINYKHNNNKRSIGVKRNSMIKQANYKHFAMLDSDDIYMPSYIQYSIEIMKTQQKTLVGSNQMLFVYPFHNFDITAIKCEAKRQIHEATMVFSKRHWQSMGGFEKNSQGEGAKMVDFNDNKVGLTEIKYCMMCVCHKKNTVDKEQFLKNDGSNKIEGSINPTLKKLIINILDIKNIEGFEIL